MSKNILALFTLTLAILYSCGSKKSEGRGSEEKEFPAGLSGDTKGGTVIVPPKLAANKEAAGEAAADTDNSKTEILVQQSVVNKKKIVKDGNMSIKTRDINARKKDIDDLLKKLNAYYEREDLRNNSHTISYDLKIRVPAEGFEKLVSGMENGQDEIKNKSIQARDVTEEYIDIETRLTNKREYLKRYKALLSRASTIKEILTIEEKIRELQEEIESKEGRLKYLSDQISFSALDVNLYQEKEFVYKPQSSDKFSERVKKSLSSGWTWSINFVLWAMSIWPLILGLVAFFAIRRAVKKRKKKPLQ